VTRRCLPLVADLRDPACLDARVAGGKGAGLARLARAGLPTLPGLVVTTAVHRAAGGRAPGRLRGLWGDLAWRLAALGPGPYAVRSSAFAEDGEARSWAGLLETRLGVPASGVVRAIGRVWRSAASPRAAAYGPRGPGGVAVVIQPLARARAAGTCFTATPVRARTPLLVVEAVAGLGAPLVGGLLTPDRYLIDRRTGIVLEARPARQPWALRPRAGGAGLARGRLPAAAAGGPKLAPAELRRIARLALAAERRLGRPQDVEWVLTDHGVALLQARPLAA
jgi:phosphoenolpyruvate synthase/pyruvate phosphate dikinase